jgi:chromate transporter
VIRPTAWQFFRAWFDIGSQSFGGGASTLLMMRRVLVDQKRWVTPRQFAEAFGLAQLSPGIHFVALAGLLGRTIAGPRGIGLAVAGMMVPSGVITAVFTVLFVNVSGQPFVAYALSGAGPVAAGMTMGLAVTIARPLIRHRRVGAVDVLLVVVSCFALLLQMASPMVTILAGAAVGAVALRSPRPTSTDVPMS